MSMLNPSPKKKPSPSTPDLVASAGLKPTVKASGTLTTPPVVRPLSTAPAPLKIAKGPPRTPEGQQEVQRRSALLKLRQATELDPHHGPS